jgi:hypothetical protein
MTSEGELVSDIPEGHCKREVGFCKCMVYDVYFEDTKETDRPPCNIFSNCPSDTRLIPIKQQDGDNEDNGAFLPEPVGRVRMISDERLAEIRAAAIEEYRLSEMGFERSDGGNEECEDCHKISPTLYTRIDCDGECDAYRCPECAEKNERENQESMRIQGEGFEQEMLAEKLAEAKKEGREGVLNELFAWCYNQRSDYDLELRRLTKVAPHLYDKLLCLATDSSMCGQFLDKIESIRGEQNEYE